MDEWIYVRDRLPDTCRPVYMAFTEKSSAGELYDTVITGCYHPDHGWQIAVPQKIGAIKYIGYSGGETWENVYAWCELKMPDVPDRLEETC